MVKNIYEEAEISEDIDTTGPAEEETTEEWMPTIGDESPKEKLERKGLKNSADGRVLTIKNYFFTKPKIKSSEGIVIEPKKTQEGSKSYYPGKLGIRFAEDNLVEYYPSFHYFINDGKISNVAKINRSGDGKLTEMFKLAVAKMGRSEDEVSDKQFYEFLVGKKVKIQTTTGKYLGKDWFRNDIVAFV